MRVMRDPSGIVGSRAIVLLVGAALLVGVPAWAHHNMRAAFDLNTRLTRTGTLTRLEWTNPHVHLFVATQNDQGQAELWSFEGPAPGRLRRPSFDTSVGQAITVEASPSRNGKLLGLIREVRLSDGQVVGLCPQNC